MLLIVRNAALIANYLRIAHVNENDIFRMDDCAAMSDQASSDIIP